MNNAVLNLLGLALRGGNLTVGEEPVEAWPVPGTHGS